MTGIKINRLTAIRLSHVENYKAYWVFSCECGNMITRHGSMVRSGGIKSCGCLKREASHTNGKNNKTHGLSKTKLYDVHRQMMQRCYNVECKDYKNYGGRGIFVCNEWMNLAEFISWAENSGYKNGLTIERINVNEGYYPDNCTWIANKFQAHNTRKVKTITFNGETNVLSYFADKYGISVHTLIGRHKRGWDISKMLTLKPLSGRNQFSD